MAWLKERSVIGVGGERDHDQDPIGSQEQERPAVADKPARRLRNVRTVYARAVGL